MLACVTELCLPLAILGGFVVGSAQHCVKREGVYLAGLASNMLARLMSHALSHTNTNTEHGTTRHTTTRRDMARPDTTQEDMT